jgi:DNA modification methylase
MKPRADNKTNQPGQASGIADQKPINRKRETAEGSAISSAAQRLRVEYWPAEKLKFYERNPRKNDKAVDQIRASIREYGFAVPILAKSDGEVIDGHLRLKGAIAEKMREVPVIPCDGWTDAQVKAFRLMVNRSVNWAEWDLDALALEFEELKALDFDLSLTGFDAREIDAFTLTPNAEEDDAPPLPEVPVSRLGDLWLCGPHRVLCGDSTNVDDVARLLSERKPILMIADQPYGVAYDPEWRKRAGVNNSNRMGKVSNDDRADWRETWALFPGDVAYVWHGALHAATVAASLEACDFQIRSQVIWAKPSLVIGRGHYHWQHEPCWYAVRTTGHWNGDRKQSTLWQIENRNQDAKTIHSTQKPVECMRRPILNHTKSGAFVYDPFFGSGTTMMAAELSERVCCGIDIDPRYVDVAVIRWQDFTGKKATLEGDGRTFEQVKAARLGIAA